MSEKMFLEVETEIIESVMEISYHYPFLVITFKQKRYCLAKSYGLECAYMNLSSNQSVSI